MAMMSSAGSWSDDGPFKIIFTNSPQTIFAHGSVTTTGGVSTLGVTGGVGVTDGEEMSGERARVEEEREEESRCAEGGTESELGDANDMMN